MREWDRPILGLLLDVDDTLVDTRAAMRTAGIEGARSLWPGADSGVAEAFADRYYADPGRFFDAYSRGAMDFGQMRAARFEEAREALGLPPADQAAYEAEYRRTFAAAQVLYDDVPPLIATALDHDVRLAYVSNSGAEQNALKLTTTGLWLYGPSVTTDTLGVGKPDPRVFAYACALLALEPEDVVCVGDTLGTDILGARGAGIRAAWIQRRGQVEPRDAGWGTPVDDEGVRVVTSLAEVGALVRARR